MYRKGNAVVRVVSRVATWLEYFLVVLAVCQGQTWAQTTEVQSGIAVLQPLAVPTVNGPDSVCQASAGLVYTTESGMSGYIWSVTQGGTITGGQGSSAVIVDWGNPGLDTIWVTYSSATSPGAKAVMVMDAVPAGLAIAASANPVCAGTTVTYTATPVNGGSSPSYQWSVNGLPVGSNAPVYTYTPASGDVVGCLLTSTHPCATGNPVAAIPVVMVVEPNLPAGITITASANPVCQGTSVTLAATVMNPGTTPSYQWRVNGFAAGSNASTFTCQPSSGDIITCMVTSSAACVTNNPALSNPVTMAVGASQPVSVSITSSANPSCAGQPVTLTASAINGGSQPAYQWAVNSAPVGGNSNVYSYIPQDGDAVICHLMSNAACATGSPATSNMITMNVGQILPVSVSVTPSMNPVCQGTPVTFTAVPLNGGTAPYFQWKVNGFNMGPNSSTLQYTPANGDIVACQVFASNACASGNPATSSPVAMIVNPVLPVSITIAASSNPVCSGTSVTFTSSAYNAGPAPAYQWMVNNSNAGSNASTFTYMPESGDVVTCVLTSDAPCTNGNVAVSNPVTITVGTNQVVGVTVAAASSTVCQGMTAEFTATAVNGGSAPVFQWKVNGLNAGSNSPSFSYLPSDADVVECELTSSAVCTMVNPVISDPITVTVIQSQALPVSIAVTPSANPGCSGQQVTYTGSAVNGGASPSFQWTVNGVNVGNNNPVFSYIPASGDVVICVLTSSYVCATGNPATSNQVVMTVNPVVTPYVGVTASANPSCQGTNVTFTANVLNGGNQPFYEWKVNGQVAGSSLPTYSYAPANGDVVSCRLTSSASCTTVNPVLSNNLTMTVHPVIPVTVSIATPTNPSCQSNSVTYTATPVNGGTSPIYQWKVNGNNTGPNNPVVSFIPANGDVVACQVTSNAMCYSGSRTAMSNEIIMTTSAELAPSITIAASSNPYCQGVPVTFTATPVNGGTAPGYQWKVNCVNAGANSRFFTYIPADGDFVTCQVTSSLSCAIMNPAISNAITMRRNTGTPASVSVEASANPVCQGGSVTMTALPFNGGSAPVYQWKVNGANQGVNSSQFTFSPAGGDIVTCQMTSNAVCVSNSPVVSPPVSIATSPALPASVTISTRTNPFCEGSAVTLTATPVNGGSAPMYQWMVNGSSAGPPSSSPSFTAGLSNGDIVSCLMTSSSSCLTGGNPVASNSLSLTSSAMLNPSVNIAASAVNVCQGTRVTFTATAIHAGESPVYQWLVNGQPAGTNSTLLTYPPVNGDVVSCLLTSGLTCATTNPVASNSITLTVEPSNPVSVTIAASSNPCCVGTEVTFTAAAVNGGPAPVYQWRVNCVDVGSNSPTYAYIPANGDVVVCILTSAIGCATGNPATSDNINMVVLPLLPVGAEITTESNPFCLGSQVTFESAVTNGGISPTYEWKVNNISTGPGNSTFTYPPDDGDVVTCLVNSSLSCVTGNPALSNPLLMNGNTGLPAGVLIESNWMQTNNTICQGTYASFTPTVTNGGTDPTYQWKVNGTPTGTNRIYQFQPSNGDVITCEVTSSLTCATPNPATSNAITMTVNPSQPLTATITATANPSCVGNSVTYNATLINGGTNPVYRWRVNGANTGTPTTSPTFTYVPVNGDVVLCRVTSNALCATSNPSNSNSIIMIVNPNGDATVSIAPSANPVCAGTQVTFTAVPFNGGTAPVYQWKVNGMSTGPSGPSFTYAPQPNDTVTCVMTSNSPCTPVTVVVSNPIVMNVSPIQPVSISITASSNPTCIASMVQFTATPSNGGTTPAYQWKVNGVVSGGTGPVFSYVPVHGDVVNCRLTSNASCTTGNPASSNSISMTVSESLPVSLTIEGPPGAACQGSVATYTATPVNGGDSPVFQWRVNGIDIGSSHPVLIYPPTNGDFVTCILQSSFSCGTGNPAASNPLVALVNPTVPTNVFIASSANPVCQGTMVNYFATALNGGITPVYQWFVNGLETGGNQPLYTYAPVDGDSVRCRMTSSEECPAINPVTSMPVVMTVFEPSTATISVTPNLNPVCPGMPVTFTPEMSNGGVSPILHWKVNGITQFTNNGPFTYVPSDGDTVTCEMTSGSNCVSSGTVTSDPVIMAVSSNLLVSVSVLASDNPACLGYPVTFTATPVNGGGFPAFQWMVNGIVIGEDSPLFSFTPSDGDQVSCRLTSDLICASGNPAYSDPVLMSVVQNVPVGVTITVAANPLCTGTQAFFTALPFNGGANPQYEWKVNGIAYGANQQYFSYIPLNGDVVSCSMVSSHACSPGTIVNSNTISLVVADDLPVSISVAASQNPVCSGTPVTFTASAINGGILPAYQWKVNGNIVEGVTSLVYSYVPADGDMITCTVFSDLTCGISNPSVSPPVIMGVNSGDPASVGLSANPPGPVCNGTTVTYTAMPVNGGSPSYQWFRNGIPVGQNQPTLTLIPGDGDIIQVAMTSSLPCVPVNTVTSNSLSAIVQPVVPAAVSIQADNLSVCQGTPVTFTASAVNGGNASYQWYLNDQPAGNNQATFTFIPVNLDEVRVEMTSGLQCASGNPAVSNTVVLAVEPPLPVSLVISADQDTVCEGMPVTFTASAINSGIPAFQWYVNNIATGGNQSAFTYVPANGDVVHATVHSSLSCIIGNPAVSNSVSLIVTASLQASLGLSLASDPVCQGTTITVTAIPQNGGNPSYQWYLNGQPAGGNQPVFSFVPADGDEVYATMTSSLACITGSPAISDTVVADVLPVVTPAVTISASQNPVCAGIPVTVAATPVNGGNAVYQWFLNNFPAGIGMPVFTFTPADGDQVRVEMTSDLNCVTGNPAVSGTLTFTVNPVLPVSVSITADQNNVCEGTTVQFTATHINGGAAPVYQWYRNGLPEGSGQPVFSFIPDDGDEVYVVITSGLPCTSGSPATSNTVLMQVNPNVPAGVTITADQNTVCQGVTVTFTAVPVNGGNAVYQWYRNNIPEGLNLPVYTCLPADGDVVHVVMTSGLPCVSGSPVTSNPVIVTVNPILPASVTVTPDQNNVCEGTTVLFTAVAGNGGNPSYQWYENNIPVGMNQSTYSAIPGNGDQVYVIMTSTLACVTGSPVTSNTVTMTVNPALPAAVTAVVDQNGVCHGTTVNFTATPVNGGNPVYQWFHNNQAVGFNQPIYSCTPENGDQVYVIMTSGITCATGNPATSNVITMEVEPLLPVSVSITPSQNQVCEGTGVLFTAIPENGGEAGYQWYRNALPVGENSPYYSCIPANGDQVLVVLTSSLECTTGNPAASNTVIMVVNPQLPASVMAVPSQSVTCEGSELTYTAIPSNGGIPTYQWYLNDIETGGNQAGLTFVPVDGDRVRVVMTSSLECVTGSPATSGEVTTAVSPVLPVSVTIETDHETVCQGQSVTLTAIPVNGGNGLIQWRLNGISAGGNELQYSFQPSDGDVVDAIFISDLACVSGNPATSNLVTVSVRTLPGNSGVISGPSTVCAGEDGLAYSIDEVAGADGYSWILPPGASIVLGQGTRQISVSLDTNAISGAVRVSPVNICGEGGISEPFTLVINPLPDRPTITLEWPVLSSSSAEGNQWFRDGTAIGDSSGQTFSAPGAGWYWCVVSLNGCPSDSSNHVWVDENGPAKPKPGILVYPVPNDGHFTVSIITEGPEKFTMAVYNELIQKMYESPEFIVDTQFKEVVDLRPIRRGLYLVVFRNGDSQVVKKIIVEKK